ncbi:MAG: hypothetical protein MZV64_31935 [Ignavibacteriales bacterium]|nr:hypothetical protein [Ignavibacteriales bacterium]
MVALIGGCDMDFNYPISDNWDKIIGLKATGEFSIGDDSVWSSTKFDDESQG